MTKSVFKKHLEKIASELKGFHSIYLISTEGIIIEEVTEDSTFSSEEIAAYITEIKKTLTNLLESKMKSSLEESIFLTDNIKTCLYIVDGNIIMLNLKQDGEFSRGRHILKKYARKIEKEL